MVNDPDEDRYEEVMGACVPWNITDARAHEICDSHSSKEIWSTNIVILRVL